jgi:ATP-binding cassette subfamily B protein
MQPTAADVSPKDHHFSLRELIQEQRARYLTAIAAMAIGNVFLLLVPLLMKYALDALDRSDLSSWTAILPYALGIVLFQSFHGFFTYLRGRWSAEASEGIVRKLRHHLYAHLERLPCRYHDRTETGDLVQRCSSDVETVRVFLASQIVEISRVTLFFLIAVPIMFWHNWQMSLLCLILVPVILSFAVVFFRRVRHLFEQVDRNEGRLTTVLQENLTGIRVVRAFARQEFEIEKFAERNRAFRDAEFRLFVALSQYWALSDVLVIAQLGIGLVGGAYFVVQQQITLGTWVFFWWLLRTIIWPVRQLGRILADSGKATVAIGRIQEILDEPEESREVPPPAPLAGEIRVRDLTFSYGEGAPALDDLSMMIHPGETIALLGPPGAGKTTLISLLVRLYDYETGTIHIGDREIRSVDRDAVREAFGVVLQDPFLYSKSVRDNVLVGRTSASDHEVEESTRAADLHGNITEFHEGYDTKVGERGVTLSGGQRQRLAIARALLKKPQFLVLDDSLSAVDTKTESHILKALAARRGKQTTILIAHRLSSTRLADRIFVLDHGRIVQQGTHDELLSEEGPYRRLWSIQGDLEAQISQDLSGERRA